MAQTWMETPTRRQAVTSPAGFGRKPRGNAQPGADVAGEGSPVLVQMWHGGSAVSHAAPFQSPQGGERSPGADVAGGAQSRSRCRCGSGDTALVTVRVQSTTMGSRTEIVAVFDLRHIKLHTPHGRPQILVNRK